MVNNTTREAAKKLGVSESWLNKSRMNGTGPRYIKIGGKVNYPDEYIEEHKRANTRTAVYDFANDNRRAEGRAAA